MIRSNLGNNLGLAGAIVVPLSPWAERILGLALAWAPGLGSLLNSEERSVLGCLPRESCD